VIVAYRPTPPQGPFTVYAQQNAYFNTINRDICPRHAFLKDLEVDIKTYLDIGDHIMVMLDGNSNMRKGGLFNSFMQLLLREVIIHRHGNLGPATHKRNSTSTPIDGIWFSPGLSIDRGGYFEYDEVIPLDHRCLWVDMSYMVAFGHTMPPLGIRTPRRLHCRDPRLIENYVHLFHQFARPLDLFKRVKNLDKQYRNMSKTEAILEYEDRASSILPRIEC
jgi:hypothetical protein